MADSIIVDPKFLNIDFSKQPEFTQGDLTQGRFGSELFGNIPNFAEAVPELGDRDIEAYIERISHEKMGLEWLVKYVLNQGREGSCVGNGVIAGTQVIQAKEFGLDDVTPLSAISLYQLIGRSANSGAMVDDGLETMQKVGAIPLDTPENREKYGNIVMPPTGFRSSRPEGWEKVAKWFRIGEFYVVKTVNSLMTALIYGFPVIVGREGHCICYLTPLLVNGKWAVLYVNSWGEWGMSAGLHDAGFGVDTISQVKKSARYAFAIRSANSPILLGRAA